MSKSALTKIDQFHVERRDIRRSLSEAQYRRLIEYLKYGYDCLKVIDSSGESAEVSVDDLINLLEGQNDIHEIVIERVKLDEATTHHLVIGKKSDKNAITEDENILAKSGHLKLVIPGENDKAEKIIQNTPSPVSKKNLDLEKKHFTDSSIETVRRKPTSPSTNNEKAISLEKRFQDAVSNEATKSDNTNVGLSQLRISKAGRDYSELFFKIKNHHEAFSLGASFAKDLDDGQYAFGIYGDNKSVSKCNTLYALIAFMVYQRGLSVTAVLSDEYDSIKELISNALDGVEVKSGYINGVKCEHIGEVTLIRDTYLTNLSADAMKDFMDEQKSNTNPIFIDLPNRVKAEGSMGRLLPMYRQLDSFTLVMDSKRASITDVRQDLHFMRCYGFKLKGVVLKES